MELIIIIFVVLTVVLLLIAACICIEERNFEFLKPWWPMLIPWFILITWLANAKVVTITQPVSLKTVDNGNGKYSVATWIYNNNPMVLKVNYFDEAEKLVATRKSASGFGIDLFTTWTVAKDKNIEQEK